MYRGKKTFRLKKESREVFFCYVFIRKKLPVTGSVDKETLQIVFFRMLDIPTEQIAEKMGLTPNAIYLRINRLKEKIKKLKNFVDRCMINMV